MLEEEFKGVGLEHNLFHACLLEGLASTEEKKEGSPEHELPDDRFVKKPVAKPKGRPKGEKNPKAPEKKPRDTPAPDHLNRGHWSLEENKRYHWFLEIHNRHFICKEMRRLDKIFKAMATFIGTREAEQCRSHHQKMEKKHISFSNILLFLRNAHYSSNETHFLADDLATNEVVFSSAILLSAFDLMNLDSEKPVPLTPSLPALGQQEGLHEELGQREVSLLRNDGISDFFGENYENNLYLENLLF